MAEGTLDIELHSIATISADVPRLHVLLSIQFVVILVSLAILAIAPPVQGVMIVAPLSGTAVKPWLDKQPGVTVMGLGRIRGSLIVTADRNSLFPVAIAHRAVLLPALPMLCASDHIRQDVK